MPSQSGRARECPEKTRASHARDLARAFLILLAGIEAALLVVSVLVDAELARLETHLILVAAASIAAALGLFMTWGDPGSRLRNAARALFALFVLVGGVFALLLWAAATAGEGS